jgi:hypothetical protein
MLLTVRACNRAHYANTAGIGATAQESLQIQSKGLHASAVKMKESHSKLAEWHTILMQSQCIRPDARQYSSTAWHSTAWHGSHALLLPLRVARQISSECYQ